MASFTFPIPDANYDGGKPAIGTNVRDDTRAIRTFIIGPNLDQGNFATLEGKLQWEISSNVQAINIVSEAESTTEFSMRRLATIGVGGDPVDLDTPIFKVSYGSSSSTDATLSTCPSGIRLGPDKTTAERNALSALAPNVIYNTDEDRYDFYDGSNWIPLSAGSDAVPIEDTAFRTNTSNVVQSWIQLSLVTLVVENGNAILLTTRGETDSGLGHSTVGFGAPTGTNIRVRFRWTVDVNSGGATTIHEGELFMTAPDISSSNVGYQLQIPAGIMTTVDDTGYSFGDSLVYALELNSLTNAICSGVNLRAQATDL